LARVYFSAREFPKAIETLKKAEKINPDNLKTKIAIGNAYVQIKDYEKALNTFDEIAKSNPEYAPSYFFQANIMELMGKRKAAVGKHERALEISPDYAPSLNNLAYLYAEGFGPIDKAHEMAKRAKQIAPKDGSVTDTLGWILFKKGEYNEALKYFLEASTYLPEEPTIQYHLGLVYLKKGMDDNAKTHLEDAIRIGTKRQFTELEDAQRLLAGLKEK